MVNKLLNINLKIVYFILKLFPTNKNKILFMSRESNKASMDFNLLINEIKKEHDYKIVVLTKKLNKGFFNYVKYYFHLYKEMFHLATSKVCVIDTYIIPVSVLHHKKSLTIIQAWHSMAAIKKFGYQTLDKEAGRNSKLAYSMNMHGNYDYIVSGSKEMIKYFSESFNAQAEKFIVNGSPKIDYLLENRKDIKNKILSNYPELSQKKNILYVPTFRKNKSVKVDDLINNIDYSKYNLIIKLHPVSDRKINNIKVFNCNGFSSQELLCIADYVITDYSAIMLEAASLDIPILLYLYDYEMYEKSNGLNINLFDLFGSYACDNVHDLVKQINNKYDMSKVKLVKNKYLDKDFGKYTKKLADFICSKMN